jgi:hypothetical protein
MLLLSTFTRPFATVSAALVAIALVATAATAAAQNLETAIMPGRLIQGHAKLEADCGNCHVRMDRAAQPRLCMDCHKEVGADVRARTGYHGRIKQQECRACHTEHKGRDANIVVLDQNRFDHTQTDFALRGKHAETKCLSCHRARVKYSATPADCLGCHRKDDKHKGGLGAKCASCHDERGWKDTHFDHATTRFPLLHSHATVKCVDCHANQHYANTPAECQTCHRKDDAHKGQFGAKCDSCHDAAKWKAPTFRHDSDTHFALRYRHRTVKCESCHRKPLAQEKLPTACASCHRKDDAHKGALGEKCESCHSERAWKTTIFEHNRDSRFTLRGKHRTAKCESCHKDMGFRVQPPAACAGCHERDDREKGHRGQLGKQCERCHNERSWRDTAFDHRQSDFPLLGRHAQVECRQCHLTAEFKDAKTDCISCHAKNDQHKERLGPRCEECHDARSWKTPNFDHNTRSRFRLDGAHAKVACHSCHTAPVKNKLVLAKDCASCHLKDDRHRERLGPRCEECHDARSWKAPVFDHNQRSRFKLEGAHVKASCYACHSTPVKDKVVLAMDCASCHAKNDDVHFGSYGVQCERCHVPENWRKIINRERNAPPLRPSGTGGRPQ